jgi:GntR family transcriptional regulator
MYLQIADDLRERIELGAALPPENDDSAMITPDGQLPSALRPGSQLPTELGLSETYSASRNTIRDAIKRLISLGLVETRQGQGTFVARRIDPFVTVLTVNPQSGAAVDETAAYLSDVSAGHRRPFMTTPRVEVQLAAEVITRRLRVPSSTQLVSRHQERYIDDVPWSLQTTFYPLDFITRGATRLLLAEDIVPGAVRYLAQTMGLTQIGYRDWITVRSPDGNEQRFFRIPHDLAVFEIFRTAFDQHKMPMRVTVTVFPTDRNQFIVNVGDDLPDPKYDDLPDPEDGREPQQ